MPTSRVLQFQLEAAQEAEKLAAEAAKKASTDMEMGAESGTKHTYTSLEEMLQLANLGKVCVEGDGNCGFYALHLASGGSLDHCSMDRSAGAPTIGDYAAQQVVRAKSHSWLTGPGEALVASQLKADLEQRVTPPSRWQSDQIEKILQGKQRCGARMGEYCADPALRAMAAALNVHLVVVDSKCGPGVRKEEHGKPPDRVAVYYPGESTRLKRFRSWANDVAPVLVRKQEQGSLAADPEYRVIIHNGEPPGSRSGHFDATSVTVA